MPARKSKPTFSALLREAREQFGYSRRELAERSGVAEVTIYKLESEPDRDPSLSTAAALARALGLSVDVLAGLADAE